MATAKQTVQTPSDEANVKTSVFEKISYGMGDVACNVVFALTSGLVTYFYTNVMSVSAAMVGMIMLVSRIFDGLSDVAIGLIMDRCIPSMAAAVHGCSGWPCLTALQRSHCSACRPMRRQ